MFEAFKNFFIKFTTPPYKKNKYTIIKRIWTYWYSIYIDFNKKRKTLTKEKQKFLIKKLTTQLKNLDYTKLIFLSDNGVSNQSGQWKNEYILVWVTGPEDLLKRIQLLESVSTNSWLEIPISIF